MECGPWVQDSAPEIVDCKINSNGMQAVKAYDQSSPVLRNCHLENNTEEGVVAMAGRCRLTAPKPVLTAPMVSALETVM